MFFFAVWRPSARECGSLLGFHASDIGASSQDSRVTRDHLYAVHGVQAVVECWSRSVHDYINAFMPRRTMLDVMEARGSSKSRRSKDRARRSSGGRSDGPRGPTPPVTKDLPRLTSWLRCDRKWPWLTWLNFSGILTGKNKLKMFGPLFHDPSVFTSYRSGKPKLS